MGQVPLAATPHSSVGIDLHLTGGEARTLARQLEYYAHRADLRTA